MMHPVSASSLDIDPTMRQAETSVEMTEAQHSQALASAELGSRKPMAALAMTDVEGAEDESQSAQMKRTLTTRVAQGVAGASIVVNIVAMAIEASAVMIVAGLIAIAIGPFVIYTQMKLQDTDTLRKVQNDLRREVNRLQVENDNLSSEITKLNVQVQKLHVQEEKLDKITKEQGTNVATFVSLVKENGKITEELKNAVKAETMQQVVAAVLNSDFDQSGNFSDQEIKILELRLQNIPGLEVDTERLKLEVRQKTQRLDRTLMLLKDIEREDIPMSEHIFRIESQRAVNESLEEKF